MSMSELARIDELNGRFAIPGVAEVVAGNGELPKIRINTVLGSVEVYLHGAQVTSWRPAGAGEVIFVSRKSRWEDGRAIRGGIPICFPWFRAKSDDAKAPAHGLVRTREWKLEHVSAGKDGSVVIVCATESDESTRNWWPHDFQLTHKITMSKTLQLELIVTNAGDAPFRFEEALHTYFHVVDVQTVRVRGLDGVTYLDNTDANREKVQAGDLMLRRPTDNAYIRTQVAADIVDPLIGRTLRTEKENSETTVVWNPWEKGAAALSDLGDDEWHQMICVEASNIIGAAVSLNPGEKHSMCATLSTI